LYCLYFSLFNNIGLDLIPEFSHTYSPLQFLGFIGVGIVIFESGMHLNVKQVCNWELGPHVVCVAVLGTVFPIIAGISVMTALGSPVYPNGLACGFALAPTSVGISLTLLSRSKQLNSRCGQIIMSAAFLDDIFSIICLVVLTNLAGGDLSIVDHIVVPSISAFAFVGFGGWASVGIMPYITPYMLDSSNAVVQFFDVGNRTLGLSDELHLFYLILFYLMFSWVGDVVGSSLLGAFVAGMLFSSIPRSGLVWDKQFKRITRWLIRLFFSATVAFSIEISDLFTLEAFWKGLILGIGPCLLTKMVAGYFVGDERWVVGIAMMARGEFAYLVAAEAYRLEMIAQSEYAIVVWALIWATIVAPLAFDKVLKNFVSDQYVKDGPRRATRIGGNKFTGESTFILRYFGLHHIGMVREVCECLHAEGFDVKKSITENNGEFGMGTFEIFPKAMLSIEKKYGSHDKMTDLNAVKKYKMATDLTNEKLDEIAKHLKETIGDLNAQIVFEPTALQNIDNLCIIEIEIFGNGYRKVLTKIEDFISVTCDLNIVKEIIQDDPESESIDFSVFYCTKKKQNFEIINFIPPSIEKKSDKKKGGRININDMKDDNKIEAFRTVSNTNIAGKADVIEKYKQSSKKNIAQTRTSPILGENSSADDSSSNLNTTKLFHVTEGESELIANGIRNIFVVNNLTSCGVFVRCIHEDSVVYSTDRNVQLSDNKSSSIDDIDTILASGGLKTNPQYMEIGSNENV
jgi:Kef-type K+ transport system membrane component KefB